MEKKFDVNKLINDPDPFTRQVIKELRLIAKYHKAKYDALIDEGFNEHQALELCKTLSFK